MSFFKNMSSGIQKIIDKSTQQITLNSSSSSAAVIFLHGLGDTAHGWDDNMMDIANSHPHIKFILPTGNLILFIFKMLIK